MKFKTMIFSEQEAAGIKAKTAEIIKKGMERINRRKAKKRKENGI